MEKSDLDNYRTYYPIEDIYDLLTYILKQS